MSERSSQARKKRIAFVTAVETSYVTLFYNQFLNLREQGFEVTAISSLEFPENLAFFQKLGVNFIEVPIRRKVTPFADLLSIFRLVRVFRREKFELIHTQMPKSTLLGAIAAKIAGIPVVNTARPLFREWPDGPRKTFFVFIDKLAARLTDLIMVENPLDYQTYLELGIAGKRKLSVQGNGIDLSRFDPDRVAPEELDRLREELGIPKSGRVIGIVARYVKDKGYLELFAAFKELLAKHQDLYLLAAAPDLPSETGTVPEGLTREMGIEHRVIMLKNRSDMERIYRLMDVFALPTRRDCFPRSLVEAAATARPIVASDIDGCRVVIENGKSGLLVPPKDPQALAQAIDKLLSDPVLAGKMGAAARQFALENLDEKKVCTRIAQCYDRLLNS